MIYATQCPIVGYGWNTGEGYYIQPGVLLTDITTITDEVDQDKLNEIYLEIVNGLQRRESFTPMKEPKLMKILQGRGATCRVWIDSRYLIELPFTSDDIDETKGEY